MFSIGCMDKGQSQKILGNVPTRLFWWFDKQFRTSFQKQESHQQEEKEKARQTAQKCHFFSTVFFNSYIFCFLILSFTSLIHAIDKKRDVYPEMIENVWDRKKTLDTCIALRTEGGKEVMWFTGEVNKRAVSTVRDDWRWEGRVWTPGGGERPPKTHTLSDRWLRQYSTRGKNITGSRFTSQ